MMKMGNITPEAGFKPATIVISEANMLTITPPRLPYVIALSTSACPCDSLPEVSSDHAYINKCIYI